MSQTECLNVVGLLSGGKDSCYNLCHCVKLGHRIVALATLSPPDGKDELDSYMYQTVGHDAVYLIAEAMGLPLYRTTIRGKALNQSASYGERLPGPSSISRSTGNDDDDHDETEDLYELLKQVKQAHPEVNAVSVGAILSNYQRVRVEHVALRQDIQMVPLSFLWQRDQAQLLDEMCSAGMNSILIKVAGAGLEQSDLGKSLAQMRGKLHRLHKMYGAHICGEGGEYETLTLDCPLFQRKIVLDKSETIVHGQASSDGVYYMTVREAHLEAKDEETPLERVSIPELLDKQSKTMVTFQSNRRASPSQAVAARSLNQSSQRSSSSFAAFSCNTSTTGDATKDISNLFATLGSELSSRGLTLAHLAHLNVYLASQRDFAALNAVYRTLFGINPPSRACVALSTNESSISLDAIAQTSLDASRKVLHVQGRSHWAAANIGPYSQAVESQGYISISGQIGLAPQTLTLVEDDTEQMTLALQHARRIHKAILEEHRVTRRQAWMESCISWLSDARVLPLARKIWLSQVATLIDDEYEEEQGEDSWDQEWLGVNLHPHDIPTLFVQLDKDGLPRGALVEWQLTAQSGESDSDDEQDMGFEPVTARGQASLEEQRCTWQTITTGMPIRSSFGIAYLSKPTAKEREESSCTSPLTQALSTALLVRVFYKVESDTKVIRQLLSQLSTTISWLQVEACFDNDANEVDVAIVWQSRG